MNKTRSNKVNGFRIMTMVRGYTDEADRILNYLENGIFDALEKQYLRSFIFAIYLDSKDPKNIVEAYTFNFKYHKIPGTDTMAPVMTLGNDLENMSLNGSSHRPKDPVAEAVHQGRLPTLREVKKSVKTMMKTLIQAITHMDELPRRRFATFKLFYTDATPDDYEPPNFNTGDFEKDRWYFMTHNLDEVPDKFSVGKVDCGFHSVNLKVASVASFLPSSTDNDDALFTGTVTKALLPTKLNTEEDTAAFQKQAEDQEEDAKTRNLAWSAEEDLDDVDAEGEDDPDYIQRPDGTYELVSGKGLQESVPLGRRKENGDIEKTIVPDTGSIEACFQGFQESVPLGRRKENGDIEKTIVPDTGSIEACFQGFQESVPTRLQDLNSKPSPEIGLFDETQALFQTEPYGTTADGPPLRLETPADHISGDEKASLPPSNMAMELDSPLSSALTTPSPSLPRRSNGRSPRLANEDEEMLDPETQVGDPNSRIVDAIQSFSPSDKAAMDSKLDAILEPPVTPKTPQPVEDIGLDCSCGITIEDPMCFCEAGCGRWYHVWCMGYHSARDPRLPNKFTCFDCRLRADPSFKYIIEDTVYPSIMEKYREIVTFRRAVKVFEESGSMTQSEFAKSMDGDINSARWYIQRLQEEG
ncbi:hypothetical protein CC2G_005502 [Coprinopsis cinerea AmutBmut pab1-1]|nr:hypothetical protein CC2G_005502 [Coprinopsis cinerea AmutBmut pab1-1]